MGEGIKSSYDAVVVGSGPNGLAAAIVLAQAGLSVGLFEGHGTVGGGLRSAELMIPGFIHDICSAIHPLAASSPFFKTLPLRRLGVDWIHPPVPLAHPLDDGTALLLERSITATGAGLGEDAEAYERLIRPIADNWDKLAPELLAPLHFPHHPVLLARFACYALHSSEGLTGRYFKGMAARSLFSGLAAHSILPLDWKGTAAFGLILAALAHVVGWPFPKGGSRQLATALAAYFSELGGSIFNGLMVENIAALPSCKALLLDVTPRQFLNMTDGQLPYAYRQQLERYRYGPGVFKMDWALNAPIPWKAVGCQRAGTVHLGGAYGDIAKSEKRVWEGVLPKRPYIILAQPSLWDSSRAPEGKHTAWAYCHVPHGSEGSMESIMEAEIERSAPGFSDCILARRGVSAKEMEHYNPNYIGGDINGGAQDLLQQFNRPLWFIRPYATPLKGVYLCSSSTPPGGGVHGMCGYHAAKLALADCF